MKKLRRNRRIKRTSYRETLSFAPTSRATTLRLYADIKTSRNGTAHLSFCELFPIKIVQDGLSSLTLINPAKWVGTRTKDQALLYSQFRPIRLEVQYIPTVGTTTQGLISFGATYNNAYPEWDSSLFMRLPQMAGGFITSLWKSAHTFLPCSTKLFQNYFALSEVGDQDIPISIMTICNGFDPGLESPGYLCVSGVMALSSPRSSPPNNVAGQTTGTVSVTNGQVVIQCEPLNLSLGDSFQAVVNQNSVQTTGNALGAPDWRKIFKIFTRVVCTVIEVTETVLKIAVAVAPILLGTGRTNNINTTGIVGITIIGRTDFQ